MSTTATHTAPSPNSRKMLVAMVGIGVLCALLIVVTYEGTLPRVERLKAEALENAIFQVLPGTATTVALQLTDDEQLQPLGDAKATGDVIYAGYGEDGQLVGFAIPAGGQGYADIIRILYGYDPNKEALVGFYVLESKETPGLGDKIDKDEGFLANFDALDVSVTDDGSALKNTVIPVKNGEKENPWEVDCITGATISSRAVGNTLGSSTARWIPLLHQQKDALATMPENN
ncbi:MAG: FMN-binding protein [Lewinella sp.]|nr:FMN-binding protein [Lewinella sp.]